MVAYCDFKDIKWWKSCTISPTRNVNKLLLSYKYEKHVYWQTLIFTVV